MDYRIAFPGGIDDGDWALQEAKGWLDVTVFWNGGERVLSDYDQTGLTQTVTSALARTRCFAETSLVVVPAVTPENIKAADASLATRGFVDI